MKTDFKRILCAFVALVMCSSVMACAPKEEILSVDSDTVTISKDNDDTDSKADTSSDKKDTGKKEDTSSKKNNTSSKNNTASGKNDTSSKNNTTSGKNDTGKFNPYKGIEKYKGKTINLALWWEPTANEQKIIDSFTDKYGISVNVSYTPTENYGSKFSSEIASGHGPDIVYIGQENYLNFIHKGLVQPIDVGCYDIKNDSIYDLYGMNLFSWKGKLYGVNSMNNMTIQRWMLYYNKTMFDNAGLTDPGTLWKKGIKEGNPNKYWNWDSFSDAAKKLSSRKNGKTIYGYTGLNTTIGRGWMLTGGSDYVTTDGYTIKNNLTSDAVLKSLTFISELRQQGYWSPDDTTSHFFNGTAAMLGEGSWLLEAAQAYWNMKDETGVVPLPCPKDSGEVLTYGAGVWSITKGAKEPMAASYFIRWWIDYAASMDYEKQIPGDAEREVFMYMCDTSKERRSSVAQAIMGYYESSMFWKMLNVSREKPNDVPVVLKSVSSSVDGVISKIMSENK